MTKEQLQLHRNLILHLRSGKYLQGRTYLRSGTLYCVLGVACDLVDPKGWECIPRHDRDAMYKHTGNTAMMPEHVAKMYGLYPHCRGPELSDTTGRRMDAVKWNDEGYGFLWLASAWERWLDCNASKE